MEAVPHAYLVDSILKKTQRVALCGEQSCSWFQEPAMDLEIPSVEGSYALGQRA